MDFLHPILLRVHESSFLCIAVILNSEHPKHKPNLRTFVFLLTTQVCLRALCFWLLLKGGNSEDTASVLRKHAVSAPVNCSGLFTRSLSVCELHLWEQNSPSTRAKAAATDLY